MKFFPAVPRSWQRGVLAFMSVLALLAALLPAAALAAPAAAEAQPTVQSAWGGCRCAHTVRYGETLSGIAAHYGVSLHALMQANQIWNPNHLYAGQRLCIPGYTPNHGAGCACSNWHVVRHGETLSGIASWYGVSVHALASCNNIWNWNHITAGTQLCIPGGWSPPPLPPPPPP
ncbi:MAG: LysM peptidoglycan-binding domain-containing protein, partial [Caldilinea sp.]